MSSKQDKQIEREEAKNDLDNSTAELSKKEQRKKLAEQMEFYFSDSNLTKDRFLRKEIQIAEDGFIDLNIFLKFNKIRQLTSNPEQIAKSLKHSEILELNEEKTMVKRKIPFVEPTQKEIDKKTLYVENLPYNVTNEQIKEFFEKFGKVSYISLPKFQSTNQLKGFAFIEFNSKDEAKSAKKFFKELHGEDESKLKIIGKFPKTNHQIIELEKRIDKVKQEISRFEVESSSNRIQVKEDELRESEKRKKEEDHDENDKQEATKSKKIKSGKTLEDYSKYLRVASKKDWAKLKDDFLNNYHKEVLDLKEKLNSLNKHLEKLKSQKQKLDEKNEQLKSTAQPPNIHDIKKGSIIKVDVDLDDENNKIFKLTRQQFKDQYLKDFLTKIVYVDLDKHVNRIFIRCDSPESAQHLIEFENDFLKSFSKKALLSDQEETAYFDKIASQRTKKQEKKEKKQINVVQSTLSKEKINDNFRKMEIEAVHTTTSAIKTSQLNNNNNETSSSSKLIDKPKSELLAKKLSSFKPMTFVQGKNLEELKRQAAMRHIKFDENDD